MTAGIVPGMNPNFLISEMICNLGGGFRPDMGNVSGLPALSGFFVWSHE